MLMRARKHATAQTQIQMEAINISGTLREQLLGEPMGRMQFLSQLQASEVSETHSKYFGNLLQVSHQLSFCLPIIQFSA